MVATSAMRDARNAAAFQAWVKAETGWNMEVISGLEEGRLIHLGVTSGEHGVDGKVLLIDLGGGSCEITLSETQAHQGDRSAFRWERCGSRRSFWSRRSGPA